MFASQSCTTLPGVWKNDRISSGKREKFHDLNAEALNGLKANNIGQLQPLFSADLGDSSKRLIPAISALLKDNSYHLLDEYYVVNEYSDIDTIKTRYGDINHYSLIYPYKTTEMYLAFFLPAKAAEKYLISLIYGKFSDGWKIVRLEQGRYTINGKTAAELYSRAKEQLVNKQYAAAYFTSGLAARCRRPCSYWRYSDDTDIDNFFGRALGDVNYHYPFPIVVTQVSSGPMLLSITHKVDSSSAFPLIRYMTHYDLKDTTAVKKEGAQVNNAIKALMPGLDNEKKGIAYAAYNQNPAGNPTAMHFDLIEK